MNSFVMHLQSPARYERVDGVTSFTGVDETGSFGILAGHERMITVLTAGIMRFTLADDQPEYLGLAEGVLYFLDNRLIISTAKYLRERDYANLSAALQEQLHEAALELATMRETIHRMEEALLKQLVRTPGAEHQ